MTVPVVNEVVTVVNREEAEKVNEIIAQAVDESSNNWNKRYKQNLNKLKSGNINDISCVYRDLYVLDYEKGLSMIEKKLLNASKRMLISEIALALDEDPDYIIKKYEEIIYSNHLSESK